MQISLYSAMSLATGAIAACTATLMLGFFSIGRWHQHRIFVGLALSAGVFSAMEAVHTEPIAVLAQISVSRVQLLCAGVHVACWAAYADHDLGPLSGAKQRLLEWGAALIGIFLAVSPGIFAGTIHVSSIASIGYSYRAAELTHLGLSFLLLLCLGMALIAARYLVAAIEGRPQALTHLTALFLLGAGATTDVLTLAGVFDLPRVLQTCVALSMLPIALVLTMRWRQDVLEHDRLQSRLESLIAERTRDLTDTQRALGRTEKLAAVGRLAGGMAHEINNPAAALIANLEYLAPRMEPGGKLPPDAILTVNESLFSARRIAKTVRQLLLLSRAAIAESEGHSFDLASVVSLAVQAAVHNQPKTQLPEQVLIDEDVPPELRLLGRGQLLEQALGEILEQLVAAAPQSRISHLRLHATPISGRVRLLVDADFRGFNAETRALLAEPFLGGRGNVPGPSLGLSASLGLLRTLGAEVALDEQNGCTQVEILLEEAPVSLPPTQPMARA